MNKKTLIISVAVLAAIAGVIGIKFCNTQDLPQPIRQTEPAKETTSNTIDEDTTPTEVKIEKTVIKKGDKKQLNAEIETRTTNISTNLYGELPSGMLPLSAIEGITALSDNVRSSIQNIIKASNNIYMMKKHGEKVIIVTENPENIRQGIDFIEINVNNGHQKRMTLGYNGKIQDSDNDVWMYNDLHKPIKHMKYDKNGDIEFTEVWNYETDNPVKYEMTDKDNKVISIRKEISDSDSDIRIEHLIYDSDGHTKINVSTTFEGANIKRFTYYNSDKPLESGSVYSEYKDGLKTKETVFSSDLKVEKVYTSEYSDDERTKINVYDSSNKNVGVLVKK